MNVQPEAIAIYARISKDDARGTEGGSVDTQIARCQQRLASMGVDGGDIGKVRVFRDDGFSGKNTDRPGFLQLQREVRAGAIKILVFAELSRVSRDLRGFLEVTDVWRAAGVEWISLREAFDTTSLHGRLIIHILMALAQFEREQTALRTRLTFRSRAQRGLWNGGNTPWGYTTVGEASGGLAIVEDEAVGVRLAFELYLQLGSAKLVAEAMNARGVRRRGKVLRPDMVEHVLRNPVYVAMRQVNLKNKRADPAELAPEDRFEVVPGRWAPIVDAATWGRVKALAGEGKGRNHVQPNAVHDFVLSGIVTCAACGAPLEGASAKSSRFLYYRHAGSKAECPVKAWPALVIEEAVIKRMNRYATQPSVLQALVDDANAALVSEIPAIAAELDEARRQVGRVEGELGQLGQRLLELPAGSSAAWVYDVATRKQGELADCKANVARLDSELAAAHRRRLSAADYLATFKGIRAAWERLNPHERRTLLTALFDGIELGVGELTLRFVAEPSEIEGIEGGKPPTPRKRNAKYRGAVLGDRVVSPAVPVVQNQRRRSAVLCDQVVFGRRRTAKARAPTPFEAVTAAKAWAVANRWQVWLAETGKNRAALAREAGVSRARVTQLLSLLRVPPGELEGLSIKAGLRLASTRDG